jgi:broad-specificity NMP kinase
MKYFIIIRGPLGVGKTTVARELARRLHAKYVSMDALLEEKKLDKVVGRCIPLASFMKADEIAAARTKNARIAVFDGNFYHKKHIIHLIGALQTTHYAFTLKAPLSLCIERDSLRKKSHGREAARAVHSLVDRFDYGKVIDTRNKTVGAIVREIISSLP